jgi:phosphonate transport system substrate-binding protein
VAFNYWLEKFGPPLNLSPTKASLFDNMDVMRQAFENGELDFILAPPILLAKQINRDKLADGFVGASLNAAENATVVLVRKDKRIKDIKDLAGKKLMMPANDGLADLFMDTLIIKTFKKPYRQVFNQVLTKEKQSAVVLALFFNQADVGMTYREIFHLMVELNPQIKDSLDILAVFPIKSPNYAYFHSDFPEELRNRIRQTVSELNNQPHSQQILNELRMSSLIPCSVDELMAFDQLILENQALQNSLKK